jgi:UDP-glucose 4-epimerase
MAERVLADACATTRLTALALRYFNPIGCDPRLRTGPNQPSPEDALGSLVSAWVSEQPFWIHGDDWDTPDGTPLRDFVHVWDVAQAIVAAAHSWPTSAQSGLEVVNVGSGRATSVRQLAEEFNRHVDRRVTIRYDGRRAGDIVGCYTSITKAQEMFGWSPSRTVADAIVDVLGWVTREGAFSAAAATKTVQREEPDVSDGSRRRGGLVGGGRGTFRAFGRHHSSAT